MIVGYYGKSMFGFVRNRQTVFFCHFTGCIILHSHQQHVSAPPVHVLVSIWYCLYFGFWLAVYTSILVYNGISLLF